MKDYISKVKETIAPVRRQLIGHPVYQSIRNPAELRVFMQYHVYAVWDFMSLLKALQVGLTSVSIPWIPKGNPNTRYLINEIVVGEESDVDELGRRTSHFELYLRAMKQAGADTVPVSSLVDAVSEGQSIEAAIEHQLQGKAVDKAIIDFLKYTFEVIRSGKLHAIAAVFTFGREDLIPDMFLRIVNDLSKDAPEQFHIFKYYLERHIEVDGDHHGHLAMAMLEDLCGDDEGKWDEAASFAIAALERRIQLWNGVVAAIEQD